MKIIQVFGLLIALPFFSCSTSSEPPEPPETAQGDRIVTEPAANEDGVIKILLYYDMEGLSGQNDLRTLSYRAGGDYYIGARKLLTDDVNAVLAGLFEGGAEEVHVVDAHGSGNPEPDILLDQMDPRAELITRDTSFRPYIDLTEEGTYDAVAVVAMHSKTGGGGFGAHTYTLGMEWILNGMTVTETEIIAYAWGRVGVPVIFATGDDALKRNLEGMPWIEFVTVKKAIDATDAELRPLDEVHREMRESASRAAGNISSAKAVKLTTPIRAGLRAVHPASLRVLAGVPGINYHDETVTFEAADYEAAYDGITALIGVAAGNYMRLLQQTVASQDDGDAIMNEFTTRLFTRWGEVESGRWSPPDPPQRTTARKYFGAN